MYPTLVFYLPEDGLIVGRNMYEVTVYINWFQYTCVHLLYILE